jgi:hypothetical protein
MNGQQLVQLRAKLLVSEVHEESILLPYISWLVRWQYFLALEELLQSLICLCALCELLCSDFALATFPWRSRFLIVRHFVLLFCFCFDEFADCEHYKNLPQFVLTRSGLIVAYVKVISIVAWIRFSSYSGYAILDRKGRLDCNRGSHGDSVARLGCQVLLGGIGITRRAMVVVLCHLLCGAPW